MSAIKVDTYGGSYNKQTSVNNYGSKLSLRMPAMPTEITYDIPENIAFEAYEYSSKLDDLFFEFKKISSDEALSLKTDMRHDLLFPEDANIKQLDTELVREIDEIVEHLTALLKAKFLAYAEEKNTMQHANAIEVVEKYKAILHDKLGK